MPDSASPPTNSATAVSSIPAPMAEKTDYFNGSAVSVSSTGDVLITLTRNGVPFLSLFATLSVAKLLSESLTKAVLVIEDATGHKVMSVDEVTRALQSKLSVKP